MNKTVALAFGLLLFSCTKKQEEPTLDSLSPAQIIERGKAIYNLNCIACHNADPGKEGATAPSILNSSKELLEARILKASYPLDYKPKRDTKLMPAFPHLEKEIPAITAFLNQR